MWPGQSVSGRQSRSECKHRSVVQHCPTVVMFVDGRVAVKGECTRQVVVSRRTASPDFCVPQFSELHHHDGRPASLLCASAGRYGNC